MSTIAQDNLLLVRNYHERTKHRPDRYAASLGYMDWANQPDPFRTFAGTEQIDLPHPGLRPTPTFDELFARRPPAHRLNANLISRLFYNSLALSAWKQAPGSAPWSLRINPSSGALHPTEGYLIGGPVPGLIEQPGVFHYAPYSHCLERRSQLSIQHWKRLTEDLPDPCLFIGLTSIYWRESWKYGERAFRYCNHDVGHAIGAVAYSARTLGWALRLVDGIADVDLNRLLGTHLQFGSEAEHSDCLLALYPARGQAVEQRIPRLSPEDWRLRVPDSGYSGEPNRLSREHHPWPVIDEVSRATRRSGDGVPTLREPAQELEAIPRNPPQDRRLPAEEIIRKRRSAVAMDRITTVERDSFYRVLERTLPTRFPFAVLPWPPRVSLAIFVHRVDDLEPGLYLLIRDECHQASLRESLTGEFEWHMPTGCPDGLYLRRLLTGDATQVAKQISCDQDIAGDGVFSLGMLAEYGAALETAGASIYPGLFWETGLLGQVLYLEAEAAGVRGTGIGCFFDDLMHELMGIGDRSWQSLYHFTVGGPIEDTRLKTIPPYGHISSRR